MSAVPLEAATSATTFTSAIDAAITPAIQCAPRELEITRIEQLDEVMRGEVSAAERTIFFLPLAARNMGLDIAPQVFRFWLFRTAKPPYSVTGVRTAEFPRDIGPPLPPNAPTMDLPRRGATDVFTVPYDRLRADANLQRAEGRIRAAFSAKLHQRVLTRVVTAPPDTFENAAQTHWSDVNAAIAQLQEGQSRVFDDLDRLDRPRLAVVDTTITTDDTLISAAVNASERDVTLGGHGVRAYVSCTVTRRHDDYLFTFNDFGIRVFDLFEFSNGQGLGSWSPRDGLLNLASLVKHGTGLRDDTTPLTNATMRDFADKFAPRYNARVRELAREGLVLPSLVCKDFVIVSPMRRDRRSPHEPIVVPRSTS